LDGESPGEAAGDVDGTPRRVDRWKGSDDSREDWKAWMEGLGGGSGRLEWDPSDFNMQSSLSVRRMRVDILGFVEGDVLGLAEGNFDGDTLGFVEGKMLGLTEGEADGDILGPIEGDVL
jgi:hypothetical protein